MRGPRALRSLALAALAVVAVAAAAAPALAQGGGLVITPTPLDFGTVAVGQAPSLPLSVANTNTDALATLTVDAFSKPATTGCNAFTVTPAPALPDTIPASTTRTWQVTFKPTVATSYDCAMLVDDNDGNDDTIHVVGSGGVATLGAVPNPVAFGPVVVGTSTEQIVTLRNSGTVNLVLGTIAQPVAPFSLISVPAAGTVVAPNGSVMFAAHFMPTATGNASAVVAIPSNDPATPYMLSLTGSGATSGGPAISLAPSPVSFGVTPVGVAAAASLAVGNTGTQDLAVTAMTITGANAADFSFADAALGCVGGQTCAAAFTVTPSATPHTAMLQCKPTVFGTRLATLTVTSNAQSGTGAVTLTCTGNAAVVGSTPASIAFGTIRVNTMTQTPIAFHNGGNIDLHVTSIAITGGNAGDFGETACASGCTIVAGASLPATVSFTPSARGARTANLHVTSDDPATPDYVVPLTGTGGAGVMVITQPAGGAIDFGNIPIGATSSQAPITIQNQGEVSLTINTITTSPSQFARGGPVAPVTLAPGATTTWQMTCTPSVVATYTGATTFTSDALTNPTQMVTLACAGATGTLVGTPAPVAFGAVRSDRTKTIVVSAKNVGGASVTVQSAAITGATGVFTVMSEVALPHALGSGQTMKLDVTFAPDAQQTFMGKLVLTDVNAATALSVNLSGDGQVAAYTVDPTAYDYAMVCVGQSLSKDVVITNTGSATIRLMSTAVTGDAFSISAGSVGAGLDLPGQKSHTVTVVGVAPSGPTTGSFTLTTDLATGGTTTVPLTISGAQDGVAATPASLDFGAQPVGVAGAPLPVSIVNCSQAPLAIEGVAITGDTAAFAEQGPAAITLPIGGAQAWSVVFTPQRDGAASGALAFTTGASPITIPVAGTGGGGAAGESDAGVGGSTDSKTYYGCGCGSGGGGAASGAPFVVALAMLLRRRRRTSKTRTP